MNNRIRINGMDIVGGRNITITNGVVMVDGNVVEGSPINHRITVEVLGDLASLTCDGNVICEDVHGKVDAGGSVTCGDVTGNVDAGGSAKCGNITGSVDAGGSVNCGSVGGNIDAGGSVRTA